MPGELQFISHQRHTVFFRIQCYRICFKNSPIFSKCSNHLWDPPSYPDNFGLPQRHCFLAHATMERTTCNEAAGLKPFQPPLLVWLNDGDVFKVSNFVEARRILRMAVVLVPWSETGTPRKPTGRPYWRSLNVIGITWRWCKVLRELKTYNRKNGWTKQNTWEHLVPPSPPNWSHLSSGNRSSCVSPSNLPTLPSSGGNHSEMITPCGHTAQSLRTPKSALRVISVVMSISFASSIGVNDFFPQTVRIQSNCVLCVCNNTWDILRCKQADLQLSNCFLGRQSYGKVSFTKWFFFGHFNVQKTINWYKELSPLRWRFLPLWTWPILSSTFRWFEATAILRAVSV